MIIPQKIGQNDLALSKVARQVISLKILALKQIFKK